MAVVDDPWSNAENMLRWKISLARKSVSENQKRLSEVGEIYPLPKAKLGSSPHGLPDQWAFGTLTPHQVSLWDAMGKLQWAEHEVGKAEAALSEGKLPDAIHWIIAANQSINSALSIWHSGGAVTMWRYVGKIRKGQAIKAHSDRATVCLDDGKSSMTALARDLAKKRDALGDYIPAKKLWDELVGLLEERGATPKQTSHEGDLMVEYTRQYKENKPVRGRYKFNSFSTTLSRIRNKFST